MHTITAWSVIEQWLDALDPERNYTLKEEFGDGTIATHWNTKDNDVFTYQELRDYVWAIWIPSHPCELIICPTAR